MAGTENVLSFRYNRERRTWTPLEMAFSNVWPDIAVLDIHSVGRASLHSDGTVSIAVPKGENVYLVKYVGYSAVPKNAVVDEIGLDALRKSGNTILKTAKILR